MVYHVKKNMIGNFSKYSLKSIIQPIMFLSKILTKVKKKYWLTKLKITGLVWIIKKI